MARQRRARGSPDQWTRQVHDELGVPRLAHPQNSKKGEKSQGGVTSPGEPIFAERRAAVPGDADECKPPADAAAEG